MPKPTSPKAASDSIDPRTIYVRLAALIQSRPHTPVVRTPYDTLLGDLAFTPQSLGQFAFVLNAGFADLKLNFGPAQMGSFHRVVDLFDGILNAAHVALS
jgi:hypothetical protein